MMRDKLDHLTRKELLVMLPAARRKEFNPVSARKADIIDAILEDEGELELEDTPNTKARFMRSPAKGAAPEPPSEAALALHDVLSKLRVVFVDPFGQRFTINPENEHEVVITGFPEPTGINEWQWFTKPLKIGGKEYDVYNPNGLLAR